MNPDREKFLKIYANLPLPAREEIICVIEGKPITWNVSFLEIQNNTKLGDKILSQLSELKFI